MQHTTAASEAPCRHCRRPLLYAWDEGLLVRADAPPLDVLVATVLRSAGRDVYVLTAGGHLVRESRDRVGSLRLVVSRHVEHVCGGFAGWHAGDQLTLFPRESIGGYV